MQFDFQRYIDLLTQFLKREFNSRPVRIFAVGLGTIIGILLVLKFTEGDSGSPMISGPSQATVQNLAGEVSYKYDEIFLRSWRAVGIDMPSASQFEEYRAEILERKNLGDGLWLIRFRAGMYSKMSFEDFSPQQQAIMKQRGTIAKRGLIGALKESQCSFQWTSDGWQIKSCH